MPCSKTQKCTLSGLQHENEWLEKELEAIQKDSNALHQKRVQEQVSWPMGCADRLHGGFSLTKAMGIMKDKMNLVRESVRSSLHANLGGPFKNGTVKYDSIDLEVLGLIRNDIIKEHPWIKSDYEGAWPVQALIKMAIENCKTVIQCNRQKKGKSIKQTPRPVNATLHRSSNRRGISTETTSGTKLKDNHVELEDNVDSDDEANELEDHANSDEDHTKPDDDHTEPDNDNSDGNSKDVGSRWSGGTPQKTQRNATRTRQSLSTVHTQVNHPIKETKVAKRICLLVTSEDNYTNDPITDEDFIQPLKRHSHPSHNNNDHISSDDTGASMPIAQAKMPQPKHK
ncbi:uncharacterized protein EI90DRAFT_3021383 [Cantharellus anzutake]|uniref:uncharacterized protein n=1 Tax=Cantharellus anzutake TaxID=1750568 RepID=UPI0019041999|nr:uncharacterized protein EI90DRAFT_3021383 [Cantharellus anzutake]KAF8317242.1 hypothetical protein EI90DRAFT_3021383 [Cantharellus anzutake]